jgi:hypothetical protein
MILHLVQTTHHATLKNNMKNTFFFMCKYFPSKLTVKILVLAIMIMEKNSNYIVQLTTLVTENQNFARP